MYHLIIVSFIIYLHFHLRTIRAMSITAGFISFQQYYGVSYMPSHKKRSKYSLFDIEFIKPLLLGASKRRLFNWSFFFRKNYDLCLQMKKIDVLYQRVFKLVRFHLFIPHPNFFVSILRDPKNMLHYPILGRIP